MKKNILLILLLSTNYIAACQTQIVQEISVQEFTEQFPNSKLLLFIKDFSTTFKPYPVLQEYAYNNFPHHVTFQDIYTIKVPKATAHLCKYSFWGINGLIFINNFFLKETQIKDISPFYIHKTSTLEVKNPTTIFNISGTVAICSHLYPECYGHFMLDVLGQLALLEIHHIEYDYLCIPYDHKFMQEALELWGIDKKKIIPMRFDTQINADHIIISSSVSQIKETASRANYIPDFVITYISQKLLTAALKKKSDLVFHPKIFISRKDAPNKKRLIPNEDQIFELFEEYGFKKYELTKLSLAEQILLFHNAQEIVSFVGSGAMNIIFSQPKTKYIEITEPMIDSTFFFLSNIFKLDYYNINNVDINYFKNGPWTNPSVFPIKFIKDFLENYPHIISK